MKAIIDTDVAVRGLVIVRCHLHFTHTISAVTVPLESFFNSNNNTIIHVPMLLSSSPKPLQEFTWFAWWMQTELWGGCQPPNQANRLGLWVCQYKWLLPSTSTSTSTIAICYYYSARNLILILPSMEDEGLVDLGTAGRVHSACSV